MIAAITAMGAYKFYKLDFDGWANRISGPEKDGSHWKAVFSDHPEFFRFNEYRTKASLVWRRTFPRNFDVDAEEEVLPDHQITGESYDRISRKPLSANEIQALVNVAVSLHERAIEQNKASRWWLPILTAILALFGSIIGAVIAS